MLSTIKSSLKWNRKILYNQYCFLMLSRLFQCIFLYHANLEQRCHWRSCCKVVIEKCLQLFQFSNLKMYSCWQLCQLHFQLVGVTLRGPMTFRKCKIPEFLHSNGKSSSNRNVFSKTVILMFEFLGQLNIRPSDKLRNYLYALVYYNRTTIVANSKWQPWKNITFASILL